jgi:hypothetical protein
MSIKKLEKQFSPSLFQFQLTGIVSRDEIFGGPKNQLSTVLLLCALLEFPLFGYSTYLRGSRYKKTPCNAFNFYLEELHTVCLRKCFTLVSLNPEQKRKNVYDCTTIPRSLTVMCSGFLRSRRLIEGS